MTRILILYATSHGHTRVVAQTIADRLRNRGARVQMVNLNEPRPPSPDEFDIVILGSRVHFNKLERRLLAYVRQHHVALTSKPSYLFSVSMSAKAPTQDSDPVLDKLCKDNKWTPRGTAAFAGALLYRSYNPFVRLLMKILSGRTGHPTDTSRDYIFTDWAAVGAFAERIPLTTLVSVAG